MLFGKLGVFRSVALKVRERVANASYSSRQPAREGLPEHRRLLPTQVHENEGQYDCVEGRKVYVIIV